MANRIGGYSLALLRPLQPLLTTIANILFAVAWRNDTQTSLRKHLTPICQVSKPEHLRKKTVEGGAAARHTGVTCVSPILLRCSLLATVEPTAVCPVPDSCLNLVLLPFAPHAGLPSQEGKLKVRRDGQIVSLDSPAIAIFGFSPLFLWRWQHQRHSLQLSLADLFPSLEAFDDQGQYSACVLNEF